MSKYCKICGSENQDDAMMCQNCGNSLNDSGIAKQSSNKLFLLIGAGAAVVVVVVLLVVFLSGAFGGASGAVMDYCDVMYGGEFDKLEYLAPKDVIRKYEKESEIDLDDAIDNAEEDYENMMENLEDEYGDVSIDYEIIDEMSLEGERLHKAKDNLKEDYDISKSDVTDIVACCVKITIDTDDGELVYYDEMYAVEIEGEWYPSYRSGGFRIGNYFY